jgi:hypothetical protein
MATEFPSLSTIPVLSGEEIVLLLSSNLNDIGVQTNVLGSAPLQVNSQSGNYTTVLDDTGAVILHPNTDDTMRTYIIDSNAKVPYPVGTVLTFVNEINSILIAINSDTMTLAGSTNTGTRTLSSCGIASALKVTPTRWVISGANLT